MIHELAQAEPRPASMAHHDSSSPRKMEPDQQGHLPLATLALVRGPGGRALGWTHPGRLRPSLLLPEALSTAMARVRWLVVASSALLHFCAWGGALTPYWQLCSHLGCQEGV